MPSPPSLFLADFVHSPLETWRSTAPFSYPRGRTMVSLSLSRRSTGKTVKATSLSISLKGRVRLKATPLLILAFTFATLLYRLWLRLPRHSVRRTSYWSESFQANSATCEEAWRLQCHKEKVISRHFQQFKSSKGHNAHRSSPIHSWRLVKTACISTYSHPV